VATSNLLLKVVKTSTSCQNFIIHRSTDSVQQKMPRVAKTSLPHFRFTSTVVARKNCLRFSVLTSRSSMSFELSCLGGSCNKPLLPHHTPPSCNHRAALQAICVYAALHTSTEQNLVAIRPPNPVDLQQLTRVSSSPT